MKMRIICLLCVYFAGVISAGVIAGETDAQGETIWITVVQHPGSDDKEPVFELQVSNGAEFRLVDTIAESLPCVDEDDMRLLPTAKIDLAFRTDTFMVMKVQGKRLTLAPGKRFPYSVTRTLARNLSKLGYSQATIESPKKMLVLTPSTDPFIRSFAMRDEKASPVTDEATSPE